MRINSTPKISFKGLWERKVKSYTGNKHTNLQVATYRPFKDEEISPEIKKQKMFQIH